MNNEKDSLLTLFEDKEGKKKNVVVALTSDKGLCGGVNSAIARGVRGLCGQNQEADISLVVVGEKGRSQLRRMVGDKLDFAYTEVAAPLNFSFASSVAQNLLESYPDNSIYHIAYNKFISAIAYIPTLATIMPFAFDGEKETLASYEFEPEAKQEVLFNLSEYYLATELFYGMMEAATSEQSSRMQAMENASKNAGELIDKLTLLYNRARQARITTELIEIISGASALE
mmetsp:Transcript_97/g.169  ORF Transcript_97/g.169 Transcript_97/m.169 type:complete len:229 (-) Transcript_97:278-964(-)